MNIVILTPVPSNVVVPPLKLSYPRVFSSVSTFHPCREVNINASRAQLQEYYRKNLAGQYDFVLLMDSDVVIDDVVVELMKMEWSKGTSPSCNTKGVPASETGHVVTSCAILSRDDYIGVDFMKNPYECQCLKLPRPFYVESVVGHEIKCKI